MAVAVVVVVVADVGGVHSRGVFGSTGFEQAGLGRGGDGPGRDRRLWGGVGSRGQQRPCLGPGWQFNRISFAQRIPAEFLPKNLTRG